MAKRPTLADVAAEAGVSRALVSIVMRHAPGASDATRERVLAAAARLGYRPDARARLLRSSRSHLLGVVFALDGAFHAEIVEALYPAAAKAGFDITLSARGPRRSEEEAIRSLLDLNAEAIIVLAPESDDMELVELAAPAVSVLQPQYRPRLASVATDEAAGIGLAVEHLRRLGHRHIAHVDGGSAVGSDARAGAFDRLMNEAGETPAFLRGGSTETDGMTAAGLIATLVKTPPFGHPPLTAVVAFNDALAVGLMHGLREGGIRIPEDLSVVGYDDSRLAALAHVQLTSVRQDPDALAAAAVGAAAEALDGRHTHALVAPSLTVRSSTAPPPAVAR
ncbi:LacI family DNA-binding transcriptional regulator [Sinomonas sp. JGH33]|uniref:LacI family DNA-binding transcriptional regulator n=1 Tax=Sinomonas terricola TaxID=3110330 RepID=A0ABU5T4P2_9MICC|nr:LacI family DNA-binding transcriptional regulator [Sinomonas sp. JGH33]MEA5454116.1 LacI family DNA-binding transcriptional regulator [Sinomonas sp. JGH33]